VKDYFEQKNVDLSKMSLKELEEYRANLQKKEIEDENNDLDNYMRVDSIT
jgi:hypothetical protein